MCFIGSFSVYVSFCFVNYPCLLAFSGLWSVGMVVLLYSRISLRWSGMGMRVPTQGRGETFLYCRSCAGSPMNWKLGIWTHNRFCGSSDKLLQPLAAGWSERRHVWSEVYLNLWSAFSVSCCIRLCLSVWHLVFAALWVVITFTEQICDIVTEGALTESTPILESYRSRFILFSFKLLRDSKDIVLMETTLFCLVGVSSFIKTLECWGMLLFSMLIKSVHVIELQDCVILLLNIMLIEFDHLINQCVLLS